MAILLEVTIMNAIIIYFDGKFFETKDIPGVLDAILLSDEAACMRMCMGLELYLA